MASGACNVACDASTSVLLSPCPVVIPCCPLCIHRIPIGRTREQVRGDPALDVRSTSKCIGIAAGGVRVAHVDVPLEMDGWSHTRTTDHSITDTEHKTSRHSGA